MSQPEPGQINFDEVLAMLPDSGIWEYDSGAKRTPLNIASTLQRALSAPIDFPPIGAAIVPGDRVALAVDPNIPQLRDVLAGVIDVLSKTEAGAIDIVLWDEATDATLAAVTDEFTSVASVSRHRCDDRSALRYLGADEAGDAIYLNRVIVDADLALPIIAHRNMDPVCQHDLTGVYPALSDSATRYRHRLQMSRPEEEVSERNEDQVRWLLGVNVMVAVKANATGMAGEIIAGTPEAISKQQAPVRRATDNYPPSASLLITSLDGGRQQQTWQNAARAAVAACRFVQPGGTIALWTAIDSEPSGQLSSLDDMGQQDVPLDPSQLTVDEEGKFPRWQASDAIATSLARVCGEYRLLVHSELRPEAIEAIGIGCIDNASELAQLCSTFESCGVLRAAQFAGSTTDAPHRLGIET